MANNRIQIKRSATTATPTSLLPGELAFSNVTGGSGVLFVGDTSNSAVVAIGGARFPGTLTANQALVANSTSGINQVIVGNLAFTGATQNILANGSVGTAGFVLASGGNANLYWINPATFSINTSAQYTWTNTQTFQNTITFGANLIVDTTSVRWVGNTTTSPTVTIANTGAISVGNDSTTQSTSVISVANSGANSTINPASISVYRSTTNTSALVNSSSIHVGNSTGNVQITPLSGSAAVTYNRYANDVVYNQAQFGGGDGQSTQLSLYQYNVANVVTIYNIANTTTGYNFSYFGDTNNYGGRAHYGANSVSGFLALWSNTNNGFSPPTFTDYTINGLRANSVALIFGNSTVNSVTNSSSFQVTGNSTTLATASLSSSGLTVGTGSTTQTTSIITIANSVGNVQITPGTASINATGSVNASSFRVGTNFIANTTQLTLSNIQLSANGGVGSQGQVLASNGATGSPYWTTVGDISSITANNGLTGGGTSGDVVLSVLANNGIVSNSSGVFAAAANGISVTAAGINVLAGNNQLVSNTTGVWVDQTKIDHNSLSNYDANRHVDHTAVSITAGNGLTGGGTIAATRTLSAVGANGISVTAAGINVLAGNSQVISNASGVFVNSATFSIATSQLTGDVALGTNTSGNYVATVAAGNGMVVAGSGSETAAVTVSVLANTGVVANSTGIFIGQPVSTTSNVTFANVVTTLLTVSGNTNLGDASADKINTFGSFSNSLIPDANVSYNIGTNALRWNEIHAANVHSVVGYFDNNLNVGGDLIITGNLVTQNVQSVVISDPMIYLAGNNYTSDLVDIGLSANYFDGSTQRHTGFFRDATDGIWKLFANSTQELSGNNVVNTAAVGYTTATLVTYLTSGGLVTNTTSVYVTANSTVNVNISANVISLSGRANNDLLFANSTGGITGLALNTTGGYVLQTNGTAIVYDYLDGGTF